VSGAFAIVAALLVFGGAPAAGSFSPTIDLTPPDRNAFQPQVAMDEDGDAIVVWLRQLPHGVGGQSRIEARSISATGELGPIRTLSGPGAFGPRIAMDAEGNALVVFSRSGDKYSRIKARTIVANGVVGPNLTLSPAPGDADSPEVSMSVDGDAIGIWARCRSPFSLCSTVPGAIDRRIEARTVSAGGVLGPVRTLSQLSQLGQQTFRPEVPDVAIDSEGDAVATWMSGPSGPYVWARTIPAAGPLGPIGNMSAARDPSVVIDADGDAFVFFRALGFPASVQGRQISKTGAVGFVLDLAGAKGANEPEIAMNAQGEAIGIWHRDDGVNPLTVQTRRVTPAGSMASIQDISPAGQDVARGPDVAIGANGDAVAVWALAPDPSTPGSALRIQARTISSADVLGPIQDLSMGGELDDQPEVASNAAGDAIAFWPRFDGQAWRIQASRGP